MCQSLAILGTSLQSDGLLRAREGELHTPEEKSNIRKGQWMKLDLTWSGIHWHLAISF